MAFTSYDGNVRGFESNVEGMRDAGIQQGRIASDYEGKIRQLANEVYTMGTVWTDASYQAFKSRFDEFLREYEVLKNRISEIGNASMRSADIVDDYENDIRQSARNIGN